MQAQHKNMSHANVLVIGGSYAGLAAVRAFCVQWAEKTKLGLTTEKLNVVFVEPRSGLINILGIPKAVVDIDFAETQYVGFEDLKLEFSKVISNDKEVVERLSTKASDTAGEKTEEQDSDARFTRNSGVEITYVQAKVTSLEERKAVYKLVGGTEEEEEITFDYAVVATGRNRNWPVTPDGFTPGSFIEEMKKFKSSIADDKIISIVGAGAVGIEMAGDIKHHFPEKTVQLIHPHPLYPPEPLTDEFKKLVSKSLRGDSGDRVVEILNVRIAKELPNGDLETTTGEIIKSDKNYWCHNHKNNTDVFSPKLRDEFVNKSNNVLVNEYLQLTNATNLIAHIFILGDLVEFPIIKSAGWAMYMGRQAANNIVSLILTGELIEPFPDLSQMPKGMVVVGGSGEIVSELTGIVELNNANYVLEYKDYCFGKVRATLDL